MARKKQTDIKIKIAVITGLFLFSAYIISAYIQSPLLDTQWQDRPIVSVSFGDYEKNYPKDKLEHDGSNYYVDVIWINRGNSNGKTVLTITAKGAQVSFNENGPWDSKKSLPYTITPDPRPLPSQVYVLPNKNSDIIIIELSTQQHEKPPPFQELNLKKPIKLTYKKSDDIYQLIDQR